LKNSTKQKFIVLDLNIYYSSSWQKDKKNLYKRISFCSVHMSIVHIYGFFIIKGRWSRFFM